MHAGAPQPEGVDGSLAGSPDAAAATAITVTTAASSSGVGFPETTRSSGCGAGAASSPVTAGCFRASSAAVFRACCAVPQCQDNLLARFVWLNDAVHVPAFRCQVRIRQFVVVLDQQAGALDLGIVGSF